jgi:SNF2 family DNA or RNA helicase
MYATASTTIDDATPTPNLGNNGNSKRRRVDTEDKDDDDDGIEALKALRESEDRARATVATRPFLLSTWVKLRTYQQTGLNWLVSTQSRRLNGIL